MAAAKTKQNPPPAEELVWLMQYITSEPVEGYEKLREYFSAQRREFGFVELIERSWLESWVNRQEKNEPVSISLAGIEQSELNTLRLQNERLKTLATSDRRAAARERERYEELLSRYDVLSEGISRLQQDNAKLLAKFADLCASVRSRDLEHDIQQHFTQLVAEWKLTRGHSSKLKDLVTHPAYQQIIGIGKAAVPLLLNEMKEQPDHWDWALRAITGANPVPRESWGRLRQIAAAWVEWGIKEGYSN
jgi:hypothetical protein